AVPEPGDIPPHERFYYLELLRRAGILDAIPPGDAIRLEGAGQAAERGAARFGDLTIRLPAIGVSPGAAYGGAKRWLAEGFAEAASRVASEQGASVVLFGSEAERVICDAIAETIRGRGLAAVNLAGRTTLRKFIDLAAACLLFLTN